MKIQVKVIPRSSKNKVVGFERDVLKVKCTTAPGKGKANEVVIELLAAYFQVPKRTIHIVKGAASSKKVIEIEASYYSLDDA